MKISIHRALSELKLIDKKIEKEVANLNPVGIYQKGKLVNQRIKEEDFKKEAQSGWDTIESLIKRKSTIKTKIVESNAMTKVTVGKNQISIADAITRKDNIQLEKGLLISLKKKWAEADSKFMQGNEMVKNKCQEVVIATVGKDNIVANKEQVESISKAFVETNEIHLADPLDLKSKISNLETSIFEFESEIDAVLSESNAVTMIEIN